MTARGIAVVGASGFVGRHLTSVASASGWEVAGVVRSAAAGRKVAAAGGQPRVVPGLEADALARALEGAAGVVHLVGIGAERDGATYDDVNVGGVRRVAEAARQAGVPRLVSLSGLGVAHYGMSRRCTNRYFLSKLAGEVELFRSGLAAVAFRPSYILGPGGELVPGLLREMAAGEVERIGDGGYRMQPISVRDAAELLLAAVEAPQLGPAVFDLVGPEPVRYRDFIDRVAAAAASLGRPADHRIREIPVEEADRRAASGAPEMNSGAPPLGAIAERSRSGGYRGLLPDELDCLLCDEVGDPRRLEALLGRVLTPLDEVIAWTVRAAPEVESPGVPQ